ncbi:MAG TPA: hypothetical protein VLB68_05320 [Pyrinomonadaceae bacterium]|nr:hypothetical protein [Pyrinomonadaceae bacterium]
MKLVLGIIFILGGGLVLLIGLIVCVVTITSDYATSACERAERDREAFSAARVKCGSPTTDCYKQATIGLTSEDECEHNKAFMNKQLIMGIVPLVLGMFGAFIGLVLLVLGIIGRRKKVAVAV